MRECRMQKAEGRMKGRGARGQGRGKIVLACGDMRRRLRGYRAGSFTACVTDPPYGLGFMGKDWDGPVAFDPATWREVLRLLKPGGHLLAFGGTRTWHRLACAIEDAGFEIRDTIMWVYGQGFPKSLDVGKAIDKANGGDGEEKLCPTGCTEHIIKERRKGTRFALLLLHGRAGGPR